MKRFGEIFGVVIVAIVLSCNWGCASTQPTATDQATANQKVKDDAADAAKMYRDRLKAIVCSP